MALCCNPCFLLPPVQGEALSISRLTWLSLGLGLMVAAPSCQLAGHTCVEREGVEPAQCGGDTYCYTVVGRNVVQRYIDVWQAGRQAGMSAGKQVSVDAPRRACR